VCVRVCARVCVCARKTPRVLPILSVVWCRHKNTLFPCTYFLTCEEAIAVMPSGWVRQCAHTASFVKGSAHAHASRHLHHLTVSPVPDTRAHKHTHTCAHTHSHLEFVIFILLSQCLRPPLRVCSPILRGPCDDNRLAWLLKTYCKLGCCQVLGVCVCLYTAVIASLSMQKVPLQYMHTVCS